MAIERTLAIVKPDGVQRGLVGEEIGNALDTQVPGYKAMTSGYAQATAQIRELQSTLSLKEGISKETAIKKLLGALRQNPDFRQQLIQQLEEAGGKEIIDKIAGYALKDALPQGLVGRAATTVGTGGGIAAISGIFGAGLPVSLLNALAAVIAFSPRAVGEAARYGGAASRVGSATVSPVVQRAVPAVIGGSVGQSKKPDFTDFIPNKIPNQ